MYLWPHVGCDIPVSMWTSSRIYYFEMLLNGFFFSFIKFLLNAWIDNVFFVEKKKIKNECFIIKIDFWLLTRAHFLKIPNYWMSNVGFVFTSVFFTVAGRRACEVCSYSLARERFGLPTLEHRRADVLFLLLVRGQVNNGKSTFKWPWRGCRS